ncbi:MAG: tRNA (guanosine(37)-N1)-methyltransferase TrmD [Acidobacteriaceae bacterium]
MRFDIVTIFPGFFDGIFAHGVLKRAIQGELLSVAVHDLREFTHDRHRTVDDRPFGGGEGMVLKPEPLAEAVEHLRLAPRAERAAHGETVILLSAQGRRFTQAMARKLAQASRVVLLCGRYEGVDERVTELIADQELSIGDYVLSGGELGAAVVLDTTMRLLPGVLGNEASSEYESFGAADDLLPRKAGGLNSTHGAGGLLDYPHYTRPAEFRGLTVPEVLSSGNHEQIRKWRREQALRKTLLNRPDLLQNAELSAEDRTFLRALEPHLEGAQSKDSV